MMDNDVVSLVILVSLSHHMLYSKQDSIIHVFSQSPGQKHLKRYTDTGRIYERPAVVSMWYRK
jgi:hypothetical protein